MTLKVLKVMNLEDLLELEQQAKNEKLITSLVHDSGKT